jgi:hypothetical protein
MVIRIICHSGAFQYNHFSFVLLFVLVMHGSLYILSGWFLSFCKILVSSVLSRKSNKFFPFLNRYKYMVGRSLVERKNIEWKNVERKTSKKV